jgi:hypothetical protein
MAGIAMCLNSECRSFNKCYRAKAKPSEYRQSYQAFDPKGDDKCEFFCSLVVVTHGQLISELNSHVSSGG